MHILMIEDDPRLARSLARLLEGDRHTVEVARTAADGLDVIDSGAGLDALILDIGLPDGSGLEIASALRRRRSRVPILMLTARDALADRVAGLDAGADDYLVKPFAYAELAARLRAIGRRAVAPDAVEPRGLAVGAIVLDETSREVLVGGRPVPLTPREFALLECFLRHPRQILTREQLLDQAWPFGIAVTPNTVDAYVAFLRRKLGAAAGQLQTVRGVGFRMAFS